MPVPDWSPEARVLVRPRAAYRGLASIHDGRGPRLLLTRPVLRALFLGSIVSLSVSGRLTLRLVLGGAVAWAFVPILQVASVALMVRLARSTVPVSRAVDLFFMGQGPWSLWLLLWTAVALALAPEASYASTASPGFLASLAVPPVWSGAIRLAFFREVLGMSRRGAAGALALHASLFWGFVAVFFLLSDQLWPRIVGAL